jgi:hypothetical protein
MRGITFGLAAALMWMATPGVSAQRQIQMVATIIDASGEALTALEPDDLRIF